VGVVGGCGVGGGGGFLGFVGLWGGLGGGGGFVGKKTGERSGGYFPNGGGRRTRGEKNRYAARIDTTGNQMEIRKEKRAWPCGGGGLVGKGKEFWKKGGGGALKCDGNRAKEGSKESRLTYKQKN